MEMTGERTIAAPRGKVWDALNDPEVLQVCIPGCESMTRTDDGGFEAVVTQKVGPVKARFKGVVTLSDVVEGEGYTISGEGKGGAAGGAKGGAKVTLADAPEGTLLTYVAEAKVTGKIAQLGSRLIDGFAKKMADQFFDTFQDVVQGAEAQGAAPAEAAPEPEAPVAAPSAAAAEDADPAPKKRAPAKRKAAAKPGAEKPAAEKPATARKTPAELAKAGEAARKGVPAADQRSWFGKIWYSEYD